MTKKQESAIQQFKEIMLLEESRLRLKPIYLKLFLFIDTKQQVFMDKLMTDYQKCKIKKNDHLDNRINGIFKVVVGKF